MLAFICQTATLGTEAGDDDQIVETVQQEAERCGGHRRVTIVEALCGPIRWRTYPVKEQLDDDQAFEAGDQEAGRHGGHFCLTPISSRQSEILEGASR